MKRIKQKLGNAFGALEKGRWKQAEILYLGCLDSIEDQSSLEFKQALHGLAFVKTELSQFTEASELYSQLLQIAQNNNNKQDEAIALHQLGMVQRMNHQFAEALALFKSEQIIYEQSHTNHSMQQAANFYEQAMVYRDLEESAKAQKCMESSLQFAKKAGDFLMIGYAYRGLGDVAIQLNENTNAMKWYEQAKSYFEHANDLQAAKNVDDKMKNK